MLAGRWPLLHALEEMIFIGDVLVTVSELSQAERWRLSEVRA